MDMYVSGIRFHNFNLCEYYILQVLNFTIFPNRKIREIWYLPN